MSLTVEVAEVEAEFALEPRRQVGSDDSLPEAADELLFARLGEIIADCDRNESNLIQVLHLAQNLFGYLPVRVQRFIASEMDLPLSKVSGVVSFYSLFTTEPTGRHSIQVCLGTACYVRGGKKVLEKISDTLGIDPGQTTADRRFSLKVMRCIGACGLAPAVAIDSDTHKRVNPNKLQNLLKLYE